MIDKIPYTTHTYPVSLTYLRNQEGVLRQPRVRTWKSSMTPAEGVDITYYVNWSAATFRTYHKELADLAYEEMERYRHAYPDRVLWFYTTSDYTIHRPGSETERSRENSTRYQQDPEMTVYGPDVAEEDWPQYKEFWLTKLFREVLDIVRRYSDARKAFPFRFDKLTIHIREHVG